MPLNEIRTTKKLTKKHQVYSQYASETVAPSYKELWIDMCKLIAKDGTPYIHNALDTVKGSIKCYSCCAFTFQSSAKADPKFDDRLRFKNGEHFILGSKQVGTVNIVQAAMHAQGSIDLFMAHCKDSINLLIDMFKVKEECIGKQSLPFARQTPIDPNDPTKRAPPLWEGDDLPYCIGIVGLNEAVEAMTDLQIHEDSSAHKMAINLLVRLQMAVMEASQKSGIKIAFARTPAETTAQRFAICDLKSPLYREQATKIIKGNVEYALAHLDEKDLPIYYTNGAMCANDADITVFERIRLEEHAFSAFDGGNIFHFFLGEKNPDPEGIFEIVKMMLEKTNIKYFAFTRDYTLCKQCNNNMSGLQDTCDKCHTDDVTQFSRITGYIQAVKGKKVSGWNKGKIEELKARKRYEVD
jgi:anaerobic ribonucleoside-triphosphate reductase